MVEILGVGLVFTSAMLVYVQYKWTSDTKRYRDKFDALYASFEDLQRRAEWRTARIATAERRIDALRAAISPLDAAVDFNAKQQLSQELAKALADDAP